MSELVAEHVSSIRLSDPMPARCAGCFSSPVTLGPDARFVNFGDAYIDRGAITDPGSGAVIDSIDELHLCSTCVERGADALAYRPEVHRRQVIEIQKLELQRDSWADAAKRERAENERLREHVRRLEGFRDTQASKSSPNPRGRRR